MPPMKVTDGTPPTQQWVPQSEPLDLNEPLGYTLDSISGTRGIHLEDLDPAVQRRIKTQPEAASLLRRCAYYLSLYPESARSETASDVRDWLAENATEESQ